jgi:Pup amidohydrolase
MALPKVIGIETEYGISVVGPREVNPTTAASMLINAYVSQLHGGVGWDFEDESPGRDARGFVRDGSMPPEVEMNLVNTVLTNGARYYVDHAHPEYSSPECSNVRELLVQDRAGEMILQRSMVAARRLMQGDEEIVVYKNNSDGKGNSYGCHENYLVDRTLPFATLARAFTTHLVTRPIYTGSGKLNCEKETGKHQGFEISQRADFFEEEVGLETTLKRPIINTRDEPHADPTRYRRLHVITGDANLCEVATFLKVGVSALVLLLCEDEILDGERLVIANPLRAMHEISHDPTLRYAFELHTGEQVTALDVQWQLFELADKYATERGLEALGPEDVGEEILQRWEAVLNGLETDPASLKGEVDWIAKRELIDAYCARHEIGLDDHRVQALDLQYHDLRPEKSLHRRLRTEQLVSEAEVIDAMTQAPRTTRAYFRGECLKRFASAVTAANWDSIVFDLGEDPLRRVPMMDPLRGTAAHVDTLFDGCDSPAELLRRLGT